MKNSFYKKSLYKNNGVHDCQHFLGRKLTTFFIGLSLLFALQIGAEAQSDINWETSEGMAVSGSALTKSAEAGWLNGNAFAKRVAPSGTATYIEYVLGDKAEGTVIGFDDGKDGTLGSFEYCIFSWGGLTVIYEKGISPFRVTKTGVIPGTVLKINRDAAGVVTYFVDGNLVYTSSVVNNSILNMGAVFYGKDSNISSVKTNSTQTLETLDPGGSVDVCFVVDDTGSMSQEINGVKEGIQGYIDAIGAGTGTVFQLITFKDNVTTLAATTDITIIKNQVAALSASGGGGCPEASYEAQDAAIPLMKRGGQIIMVTDASQHAGLDKNVLAAAANARGVNINIMLSGDCFSGTLLTDTEGIQIPYSDNKDPSGSGGNSNFNTLESTLETYPFLTEATGGLFAVVPEVNSSTIGQEEYENTVLNLVTGAADKAIVGTQPKVGPAGAVMEIVITGNNTNFDVNTTLSFSQSGITVESLEVLSPTTIKALIRIGASVPPGFVDITASSGTATSSFSSSFTSTSSTSGVGVFRVLAPSASPVLLSVISSTLEQGALQEITIFGLNTNFTNASSLNLGSGITVNSVQAVNSTTLKANVRVDASASIGFRSVLVTTGTEVASAISSSSFLLQVVATSFRSSPIMAITDNFMISDPCSCEDAQNVTVGGNYLFHDVLTVTATAGQTVTVAAPNDGEFRDASDNPITLPVTLTETTPGIYQTDFWHRSKQLTSVTVQLNGANDQIFVSSLCDVESCPVPTPPIPTMNQWGLMIFGLLILNLGIIFIYRIRFA